MDPNRVKVAMEWFYNNVFTDEAIRPRVPLPEEKLPSLLLAARSLEHEQLDPWHSREILFVKQGKLLAQYEDDYVFDRPVQRYFPTYQSLTDQELRGYFSWRTQLRWGNIRKTSLSFAFLYIYELLNQIGVAEPLEGYEKLKDFQTRYGALDERILLYLEKWLEDYVVYYDLDPALLADTPQVIFDKNILVLDNIQVQTDPTVMAAVKALAPRWLSRSKFYAANPADVDTVIVRVLRRIWVHYATRCKKTMATQYFGSYSKHPIWLFNSAVFYDRLGKRSCTYALDEVCVYECQNGLWSVRKYSGAIQPNSKLDDLCKTIDAEMRIAYRYRHPAKPVLDTKWMLTIIREEIQRLLEEKKAAEAKRFTINYAALAGIRRDAAITRDKLIVEEEALPDEPAVLSPSPPPEIPADTPLDENEYRLLQCLLYGRDLRWAREAGFMLSVLADGVNEKLYDEFMDAVLIVADPPALIEDYIDDLKEMVRP